MKNKVPPIIEMLGHCPECGATKAHFRKTAPAARPRWRSIKTAPLNETVLVAAEFDGPGDWRIKCGYLDEFGWHIWGASWKPTRWMPLPKAPNGKSHEPK